MDMAYAAPADPEGVADDAEQRIYDVARREDADEVAILRDLVDQAMVDLENIQNRDTAYTGLPSGFRDLDDLTSGLQPGNLIVIAARPGVGKSSLATNIARNVAIGRHPVALFSLEMSRYEIGMRLLCSEARVAWDRIRNKRVGPDDWSRVVQAAEVLHDVPLHIVDAGNVNIVDIRAKARRMRTGRQGLELIIVDYLQLMTSPLTRRPDNRQQEVAEISRSLKLLAKELHVPVIALVAAQPQPGGPSRQAAAAVGPSRVGRHRAGLRCRDVHPSRRRRSREEAPDRADHREAPKRTHRQHPSRLRAVPHAVPQRRPRRAAVITPAATATPRRIRAILNRLRKRYGELEPPRRADPLDELILTVLSQHTSDLNAERSFEHPPCRVPDLGRRRGGARRRRRRRDPIGRARQHEGPSDPGDPASGP